MPLWPSRCYRAPLVGLPTPAVVETHVQVYVKTPDWARARDIRVDIRRPHLGGVRSTRRLDVAGDLRIICITMVVGSTFVA